MKLGRLQVAGPDQESNLIVSLCWLPHSVIKQTQNHSVPQTTIERRGQSQSGSDPEPRAGEERN